MAELDDAYANMAYIPDGNRFPDVWATRSLHFLQEHRAQVVHTGPSDRARFLFWRGGPDLLVIVHGGYWLKFAPEEFAHLAGGALRAGWSVAMPAYPLAPAARLPQIVQALAGALEVMGNLAPGRVHLTGHSAGGHLVARLLAPGMLPARIVARIARVVPISPLSDLRPLLRTSMNADLKLDAQTAQDESPVFQPRPAVPVHVWVGGAERPVFLDQARWLAEAWTCPVTVDTGRHHFDVIEGLEHPSALLSAVIG